MVEYEPDTELRDTEQIPLQEPGGLKAFLEREVLPHAPDAWYVPGSVKIGYVILRLGASRGLPHLCFLATCEGASPAHKSSYGPSSSA